MPRIASVTISVAALLVVSGCSGAPEPKRPAREEPAQNTWRAAELSVTGRVEAWCGAWGGCAYFAALSAPGQLRRAEFNVNGMGADSSLGAGLPAILPVGDYEMTFSIAPVSDSISNGIRALGPAEDVCSASFRVIPGQRRVAVETVFGSGTCTALVTRTTAF